jgi:septal ring factor EnvC (AmiA/AmiB activator)
MARRVVMLRAAAEHRKEQIEQLLSLRQEVQMERDTLTAQHRALSIEKAELKKDLGKLSRSQNLLNQERKNLNKSVAEAKNVISKMSSEQKRVVESKLEHQAELNNAKKELRRLQALAKDNKTGDSFSSKLTDLKLPVVGGKVKRYKGNMAEISGSEGAAVTSIYEGKVLDIKQNKVTNHYEIYIAHGKYITSYANLSAVSVAKNATVQKGQRIGTIGSAINLTTLETENKIVFGIYSPNPDEVMSAANCFKK